MADVKKDEESFGLDKKTFSPYTLNANDNPGNIVTQVQLKGENYDEWARAIQTTLRAKKKYGFIDGTVKQPADDSLELEDWWTVNSMLVSWVFNTIEPTLRSTISYMENVKDLWEDIRQRFSIGNGPRVQELRSDLANCKQDGQAIITYYGRLKTLWDVLNNYDQIPVCTCIGCRCNLTIELERKRKEERVHQFLMGLDEEVYGTVRSNILSTEPLPNLNRVYAMVVQQERDRNSRKLIGAGERREGLYFLKGVASAHTCKMKGVTSFELWHMRMGHPSSKVVELIPEVNDLGAVLTENRGVNWSNDVENLENDIDEQHA
ncbi:hypothetical protein F0562_010210 [Nyssa sinensis]|uniref:Retrotransposon Copia-like N-terminal domain-containing protein n=1 Tax=Nyssa sinensis TaxID=561372 RepID=A0A5J5A133_9ASTE|nr:hypothetical protein F0562_010210 [Nyssa sinensis]